MDLASKPTGRLPWAQVVALALASALAGHALLDASAYVVSAASFALAFGTGLLRRGRATRFADADRRRIERLLGSLMIAAAMLVPMGAARSPAALRFFGVASPLVRHRLEVMGAAAVAAIALAVLLPLILAEIALRASPPNGAIDARRVVAALRSGLVVAVVVIGGAVATAASGDLHLRLDASRDGLGAPGSSTRGALARLPSQARASLFFSRGSEVSGDVRAYFEDLAGDRLEVVSLDRAQDAVAAAELGVEDDGVIVLAMGPKLERIQIGTDPRAAVPRLRRLDGEVERALRRLSEPERTVYLTAGHREAGTAGSPGLRIEHLRRIVASRNTVMKELDLGSGLGEEVPSDASMVFVLGPTDAFADEELAALTRYAERGGRLLVAIDPRSRFDQRRLGSVVGVRTEMGSIALEEPRVRRWNDARDRLVLVLTGDGAGGGRFASHPSVATLARNAGRMQLLVPQAMPLEAEGRADLAVSRVLGTGDDAFVRRDFDFRHAPDLEGPFGVGLAIEGHGAGPAASMRAFVLGDVDALCDEAMSSSSSNPTLVLDVLRWLGGDDASADAPPTEPDRVVHTRRTDAVWFLCAIVGMPALLAIAGFFVRRRLVPAA